MKKISALLLALTMLVSLCACSSKTPSADVSAAPEATEATDKPVLRVGMECGYAPSTGLRPMIQTELFPLLTAQITHTAMM